MALPIWWQVATPHKDIREGKLNEAIFAADLGNVILGNAPLEYKDANLFFQKTYLTHGLKQLLENVFSRLKTGKGDPVIQLQTPFGGGKTHALISLYHLIKHNKDVRHFFPDLPGVQAKVAAFVGTHADAVQGRTPWGEIAYQLGQYPIVEEHDKKRISPGKERLHQILDTTGPTLILMDELLEYIVKANRAEKVEQITQGQTLAFLQEISEAVAASENSCLVITLPASILEQYDESAERALHQLQKVSGRVETVYTPVEGIEIYEVIRKRLFESIGSEKDRKAVAQSYFNLYQQLGIDVPASVREIQYREKIERAYPFHPELIDVLYERWGSFTTFQRTRGVLRLLAEVVADLYKRKVPTPLIQSSILNLNNQTLRREFIKHIGNEYETVIGADIAGPNAKAPKIDKEMGSEYEKYSIATGIATSVFLYSFSGSERKGTTLPWIRVALLREGIPSTIVGDAVTKLEEELWYFHSDRKQYMFKNQPNLNRVIVDREETITEQQIQETLRDLLQKYAGRGFEVYLWPQTSSDIPDTKNLKLVILDPSFTQDSSQTTQRVNELFEKAGTGFRVYKNALFILAIDANHYMSLARSLRRYLPLKEIQNDKSILQTIPKESFEELKHRLKEIEKEVPFKIFTAYRHLSLMEKSGATWKDLGIPTVGAQTSISERVKQYLKDNERILSRLTPKYILDKIFSNENEEKTVAEIYELALKTPGMPIPESINVLYQTIQEGVKNKFFGVKENKTIRYGETVSVDESSLIISGSKAQQLKYQEEPEETGEKGKKQKTTENIDTRSGDETIGPQPISPPGRFTKQIEIRAKIPWDRLSSIIQGVIRPLNEKGANTEIIVEIKADSKEGFDRTTLDVRVKETLVQIGATIEKWEEKRD